MGFLLIGSSSRRNYVHIHHGQFFWAFLWLDRYDWGEFQHSFGYCFLAYVRRMNEGQSMHQETIVGSSLSVISGRFAQSLLENIFVHICTYMHRLRVRGLKV